MYWYFSIRSIYRSFVERSPHASWCYVQRDGRIQVLQRLFRQTHVVASRAPAVERLDRRKEHNRYQIDLAYACGSKSSSTLTLLASFLMTSLACAMAEGWSSRLLQQSAMFSLQDSQRTARVSSSAPEASSAALV